MARMYNWAGILASTGLARSTPSPVDVGLSAESARALLHRIQTLGQLLDEAEAVYEGHSVFGARRNPGPTLEEIFRSALEAFDVWAGALTEWSGALRATHSSADRACRDAEFRQYTEQLGHVPDPTAATVDGVRYHLAFEDDCAIGISLLEDGHGHIAPPPREPATTGASLTLNTSGTPALRVSARDLGDVGNQVRVAIGDGDAQLAARLVGDVAAFGALVGDSNLVLLVNGFTRSVTCTNTMNTGEEYAGAINFALGDVVRASVSAEGKLVVETRNPGPFATLEVDASSDAPLLVQLGLTSGQSATGDVTYTLTVKRGVEGGSYLRTERYTDLDWTSDGYAAQLAAIASASVLLGSVEVRALTRPNNTADTSLTGGVGGGRAALVLRLARAAALPASQRDPFFATQMRQYANDYFAQWETSPRFSWVNPLADHHIGSVGSASGLPRTEYTFGTAVADLVVMLAQAATVAETRLFSR